MRLVHELQPLLGTDITLCLDMGSFHLWMARHLYSAKARQILVSELALAEGTNEDKAEVLLDEVLAS